MRLGGHNEDGTASLFCGGQCARNRAIPGDPLFDLAPIHRGARAWPTALRSGSAGPAQSQRRNEDAEARVRHGGLLCYRNEASRVWANLESSKGFGLSAGLTGRSCWVRDGQVG